VYLHCPSVESHLALKHPSLNGCQETPKCPASTDKCVINSCDKGVCTNTSVVCTPQSGCFSAKCDSTDGQCKYTQICDDHDDCTVDACENGACTHTATDCSDNNVCTTNACVNGTCSSTPVLCDDSIDCTIDSCDPVEGCQNVADNKACQSLDPCVTLTCDVTKGCVSKDVTCPSTGLRCLYSSCVPYEGCSNTSVVCNTTTHSHCEFTYCTEETTKKDEPCQSEVLACGAPLLDNTVVVATAAALSAAAIAGIAIAGFLVGGAAAVGVAVARRNEDSEANNVGNNPLYVKSGNEGSNPMWAPDNERF